MEQVIEYAPIIVVLFAIFVQWHLFVTPVELEKKHREILNDVEDKFVSWSAFRTLKDTVENMDSKISKIYEILLQNKEG